MKKRPLHKITSRSSSVTNCFVQAIIPSVEPTSAEVAEALHILGMSPDNLHCAYCGGNASDWDHLRPMVKSKRPTGFIDEIRNLVPSCGPCNHSKSGANWLDWIRKSARTRSLPDLKDRVSRLQKFEEWGRVKPIDLQALVDTDIWNAHWTNHASVQQRMKDAQIHAATLKSAIQEKLKNRP